MRKTALLLVILGAHSDQQGIIESEPHRFVRFNYDAVVELVRAR